jgi:hydroxyacyl-ACP dehydratase HTD2-like protein with hotdog domain
MVAADRNFMSASFITKNEVRTRHRKQKSESGCNGCEATARLSNQEHRKGIRPFQFSLFFIAGLQNSANPVTGHITIYETNNTPLPQQYRRRMHSTVNQLRQHADHHAK